MTTEGSKRTQTPPEQVREIALKLRKRLDEQSALMSRFARGDESKEVLAAIRSGPPNTSLQLSILVDHALATIPEGVPNG